MNLDVAVLLTKVLLAVRNWFVTIFNITGMVPWYYAVMLIVLAVRFLLSPLLGAAVGAYMDSQSTSYQERRNFRSGPPQKRLGPGSK